MTELHYYLLFLFAWVFFQSLWISKLSRQVVALEARVDALRKHPKAG